jgi:hypothetical protein
LNSLSQNLYYSSTWSENVSNIGIGPIYGDLTASLSGTKNFDILNTTTLSKINGFTNNSGTPIHISKV